jgi:hypothetical protein
MKATRRTRQRKSRKSRRQRKTRRQRGGGFGFELPPDAIVEYRDMDDSGTNPPRLVTLRDRPHPSDSERA